MNGTILGIGLCLICPLAWAGEIGGGASYRTGGSFEVETTRDIAYREGPDADLGGQGGDSSIGFVSFRPNGGLWVAGVSAAGAIPQLPESTPFRPDPYSASGKDPGVKIRPRAREPSHCRRSARAGIRRSPDSAVPYPA